MAAYVARSAGVTREDARDALLEAIARAAVHAPDIAHLQSWTVRTALHLASDRRRHLEAARRRLGLIAPADGDMLDPERRLAGEQELRLLAGALASLPPRCRKVFWWRRVEGLTAEEIERLHGIPARTVTDYVSRALAHCRDWMARKGG